LSTRLASTRRSISGSAATAATGSAGRLATIEIPAGTTIRACLDHVAHDRHRIARPDRGLEVARVDAVGPEDAVDELRQTLRLAADHLDELLPRVLVQPCPLERGRGSVHRGERRSQLVRDDGDHLVLDAIELDEPRDVTALHRDQLLEALTEHEHEARHDRQRRAREQPRQQPAGELALEREGQRIRGRDPCELRGRERAGKEVRRVEDHPEVERPVGAAVGSAERDGDRDERGAGEGEGIQLRQPEAVEPHQDEGGAGERDARDRCDDAGIPARARKRQ
jgi:hypothetical protein